jgi:peptidyl-prolyl cis-trans isomerase-like protein 2
VRFQDLITNEPFTRKDLIQIQDPMNLAGKELSKFDHVIKDINVPQPEPEKFSNINSAVSKHMCRLRLRVCLLPNLVTHRANGATLCRRAVQAAPETMRVLQSLGSAEAKAAFDAGGGGKKSQAERILAAAKSAERAAKQAAKEAASKPGERQALTPSASLGWVLYGQTYSARLRN